MNRCYDTAVRPDRPGHSFTLIANAIGDGWKVLDIGCDTGLFSEYLRNAKGCICYGVERNLDAAKLARSRVHTLLEGSILDDSLLTRLPSDFNAIVLADVLEHLPDPGALLVKLRYKLKPNGVVFAALPNIAHISIRVRILCGKFEYEERGILDRTHLRFYTRKSAIRMFEHCGMRVVSVSPTSSVLPIGLLKLWPTLLSSRFVFTLEFI